MTKLYVAVLRVAVSFAFGAPLVWMVVSSFRTQGDIFGHMFPIDPQSFDLRTLTAINYTTLWNLGYFSNIWNSILATALSVGFGLAVCVPAGFALGVLQFRGRSAIFILLIAGFIVPFEVLSFPLADLVVKMGQMNTYTALIIPFICNGFAIFLLRQFFMAIPRSLYEAARIDGASIWKILLYIYVPLSIPAIISASIIFFVSQWQSYLWPLIVAPKQDIQLAAIRFGTLASDSIDPQFGQILAYSCVLFAVPAICILAIQKYFTASIAASGATGT